MREGTRGEWWVAHGWRIDEGGGGMLRSGDGRVG